MSFPSQPSGSDQVRAKAQAVFSQTALSENVKLAFAAGLQEPSGSGLTPLGIGESIPIVFCKRTADPTGGVFLSPRAAKLKFIEASPTGDPNYSDVQVLIPFDGTNGQTTFTDAGPSGVTITTNGSAALSTSVKKYGTASMNGMTAANTNSGAVVAEADLSLTGAWTVECWAYHTALYSTDIYIFSINDISGSPTQYRLGLEVYLSGVKLTIEGNTQTYFTSTSLNTWIHYAIVSDGTDTKLYIDGTNVLTNSGRNDASGGNLYIGDLEVSSGGGMVGYIDDFRVSGIARYTSNFTPPTAAHPTTGPSAGLDPLTRNYWLIPTSGQLDNPSLTFFYGDQLLGSGTLYYNQACPFTPVKTVSSDEYASSLPDKVGDSNGTFAGLSGIDFTYTDSLASAYQAHVFTNFGIEVERLSSSGTGASNLFSDLMNYLLQETALVPADLIDTTGLGTVGLFLENNNLLFDGAIQASTNLRQFLENGSFYFLTYVTQNDGKWGLTPRLPVNGSNQFDTGVITPIKIFTADDIIADTFERSNRDVSETLPFAAVMSYRNEPGNGPSEVKTVEVRYTGEATGGPFERYDMTEFCTRSDHAEMIGKYIIAMRRWSTHSVQFSTTQDSSDLSVGDIFRVHLDVESSAGGTDHYDETYQVISIEESQTGLVVIQGQHFPLTSDGKSRIIDQLTNSFTRPVQPLIKTISVAVDDSSPTNGQTVTFTPTIDSDLADLTYQWTTPTGSTPGQGVTTEVLSFTYNSATDEGEYILTVSSPSALDSPQSGSDFIGTAIGNVQIVPVLSEYADGNTITFTASFDGNATDVVWSWAGPAGTNAPVATETSNVLTWTAGGSEDEGTYTVTATSVTSFDSPQQAQGVLDYRPFYEMSGGTVTTDGNFKIHTFLNDGTLTVSYKPQGVTVEYLICAAGGTAGLLAGGGGGVLTGNLELDIDNYSISVGESADIMSNAVCDSSAFDLTAEMGGGYPFINGGCGGGSTATGGTGSQGGDGGSGGSGGSAYADNVSPYDTGLYSAGGGGGGMSGSNGQNATFNQSSKTALGGDGAEGITSSISGTSTVYGSGGGGGAYYSQGTVSGGTGGTGAGNGFAENYNGTSTVGTLATGYGCGSGASNRFGVSRLLGGPGIVIVRYQYQ